MTVRPENWKMIDRAFTKAEARYIPNGPNSTSDMAHPTRTGDVVAFAFPPYQYDAETPGVLVAPSHFFGQHGYVPARSGPARERQHAGDLPRRWRGDREGPADGEDDRPRADARVPARDPRAAAQPGTGPAGTPSRAASSYRPIAIVGLNDFHGQLESTALPYDGLQQPVGGAAFLATMFDEEIAALPGCRHHREPRAARWPRETTSAPRRRTRPPQDMPAIDVENAWGLDATSYGNHEFDFGVARLLQQQARAKFPFLATNIVDAVTGQLPPWVTPSAVFTVGGSPGRRHRRRAREHAGARLRGCDRGAQVPRRGTADQGGVRAAARARRQGPDRGHPRGDVPSARTRSATRRERRGKARSWASPTSSRTRPSTR